jgi:protein-disulfide isomerase
MIRFNILNLKVFFFIKILLILLILSCKAYAENFEKPLIVLGKENAPVKIKIFSSFTCPHCANFHLNVVPKIKKEYVDLGKVQLIFIDFPLDVAALNVSKLVHCIDKKKQIDFMDTIYENQSKWTNGSNIEEINNNIKKIVEDMGISSEQFEKCLINEDIEDKILNARIAANKKYSINATPTIVINEKKFEDSVNFKNIKKKIEELI